MKQKTGHFCLFKYIHVHGFRLVHVNSVEYEQIFRLNSKNVGKILVRVVIYIAGTAIFLEGGVPDCNFQNPSEIPGMECRLHVVPPACNAVCSANCMQCHL